ncbi:unnamed protein product [Symbiodinium natans]|uniref:Uncharacterized protein n=1 Tax=Symbiodinium natans TaxID=878477 RepID=A0A812JFS4_9DINO|nr:unnamed protein product [Symbiodinium natans]
MLVIVASMWGMDEVAIFYVPAAPLEKKSKTEGQRVPRTQAATPLLLRRFSIVEAGEA